MRRLYGKAQNHHRVLAGREKEYNRVGAGVDRVAHKVQIVQLIAVIFEY